MEAAYATYQHFLLCSCLALLGAGAAYLMARFCAYGWRIVKKHFPITGIKWFLGAAYVCAVAYCGATKPTIRWDAGLRDEGSVITNNLVQIRWSYFGIPAASTVYIDYRESGTTNEWQSLGETVASALAWDGVLADATNYDYYVYSTYIPPVPVHTNGVWVGQAYETKSRVGAKAFLILNGKLTDQGRTIATPSAKRKDGEGE